MRSTILLAFVLFGAGCTDGEEPSPALSSTTVGSASTSAVASGTGAGGTGANGASGSASSSAGASGGAGGSGGAVEWPSCDAPPDDLAPTTLAGIWQNDPAAPTAVWLPDVRVTAISGGGCDATATCQMFVQQDDTYADLASGAHHALRLRISSAAAERFVGIQAGDRIDLRAFAWHDDLDGDDELLLETSVALKGCAKVVGSSALQPIPASLADLTTLAYEETLGPLLVEVTAVSGAPALPGDRFGVWDTASPPLDAGADDLVAATPLCLPRSSFAGLTEGKVHHFASITGAFALFVPSNPPFTKQPMLCPRSMGELPIESVDP